MTALQAEFTFKGPELRPHDRARLGRQLIAVLEFTKGGEWYSLRRISEATGAPEASVSARLRDMRRMGYVVERRRAAPESGLWLYRVSEARL